MMDRVFSSGGLWWLVPWFLGSLVVLWLVAWLALGRRKLAIRPGYVFLVVGKRGHGKSLFVARMIYERLKAGMPVVANFTVKGGVQRMESWRDAILAPPGSTVVLDEAHQWAGARSGVTLRPAAVWYISQCRKLHHEVYVIAQHESQIASAVREQVNQVILCTKHAWGRHRATSWDPHEFRKRNARSMWAWWYSPRGGAIEVYDTMDLVPPVADRRNSHDDDVAMIVECIEIIRARSGVSLPLVEDEAEQVDRWLEAAGYPA